MAVANNDGRAIVGTTPSEAAAEVCRAGEGSWRLGKSLKVPKVGPDQAHSCSGKLMIGPDNNHTFLQKIRIWSGKNHTSDDFGPQFGPDF